MSTTSFTVTEFNSLSIVEAINAAFEANPEATVNGEALFGRWSKPATSYQNGTVAVSVPARTAKGRSNVRYFKVGASVRVSY